MFTNGRVPVIYSLLRNWTENWQIRTKQTRSAAVAEKEPIVLIGTYLQFQTEICFWCSSALSGDCCVLWLKDTSYSKCLNKWIGSAVRGEEHNGRTFNPYTDAEHHNAQRHRQTERRPYGANSGSYCLQYDRLTTESIKSARKKYPSEKAVNSE